MPGAGRGALLHRRPGAGRAAARRPRRAFLVPHLDALAEAGDEPSPRTDRSSARRSPSLPSTRPRAWSSRWSSWSASRRAVPGRGRRGAADTAGRAAPLPDRRRQQPTVPHAEERRLAYVAMTRARDELILTWSERGQRTPRGRPSPFMAEALDRPPAESGHPPGAARAATSWPASRPRRSPGGRTDPRRRDAQRDRRAALAQLLAARRATWPARCQYRLRYVVGLPTPAHHALVYGGALHAAVAAYHPVSGAAAR